MTADYDLLWSGSWGDQQKYGPTARHQRRIIASLLKMAAPVGTLLDVGCGQGENLLLAGTVFPEAKLTGTDISAEALKRSELNFPRARYHSAAPGSPVVVGEFDMVMCVDVLEHVADDRAFINDLASKCGKYLLCGSVQGTMHPRERGIGHVRNYTRGELAGKVADAGFKIISEIEWGFPFYSPLFRKLAEKPGLAEVSSGTYGVLKKALCHMLYLLFFLNSRRRGDKVFVLAQKIGAA